MTVYLDCNATTPLDPKVIECVRLYMEEEYGNAGSRTHVFGAAAKAVVEKARDQVGEVVGARRDEVVFTSGATESNNLAILGLASWMKEAGKTRVITTAVEHKAVLEPCRVLESRGFEVTYLSLGESGVLDPEQFVSELRDDVGLVSIMQVNNETGCIQPVDKIASLLDGHDAYFHVDAAQGFGKLNEPIRHERIDLISASGHKIYGPKGVGALVTRRRDYKRPPLQPLFHGGGQEKGLRPGTLPVALIAGLGVAAEQLMESEVEWWRDTEMVKKQAVEALSMLDAKFHGKQTMPNIINCSLPGINSEAAIVALKDIVAISNGSACTSSAYLPSHVLMDMGLEEEEVKGALRLSWGPCTPDIPWEAIIQTLGALR